MRPEAIISILNFLKAHIAETIFALLIAAGLTAGIFTYGTDDRLYAPGIVCIFSAVLLIFVRSARAVNFLLPVSATTVSMLLFFGYLLLSVTWSSVLYTSVYFALIFMIMPLLFIAVVCTGQAEKMLLFAIAGAGVVIASAMLGALYQLLFMFGGDFGTRVKEPFLDPNNLAVFLNMGFLPLIAMAFRAKAPMQRFIYGGSALLFFMALLATNSRMALLAAIIGFLVLLPVLIRQTKHPTLLAVTLLGGGAVVILLMNYSMNGLLFFYMREIFTFESSASMNDRVALWLSGIKIFQDHFWTGIGLAAYYFYYPQYRQPSDTSDGYFVHMDPLQIGAETGIIGYLLIYAFLICVLCRTIRVMRLTHLTSADRFLVLAPFTGLLTVCIHMHMTFCLYLPAIAIPVGVLLAWWYVMTQRYLIDPVVGFSSRPGRIGTTAGIVLVVAGLIWAMQAGAGIYLNNKASQAIAQNRMQNARILVAWQHRLSPASSYRPYEREADMAFQTLQKIRNGPTAQRRAIYEEGVRAIDEAIRIQERHGSLRNLKAMLLYLAGPDVVPGNIDQAIALLRDVLKLDPMMMEARLGLAIILRERGEFAMAARLMEEGLRWPRQRGMPDVNYIVQTAQFNSLAGNKERHDFLMKYAAERAQMYGFQVTGTVP